MNTETTKTVTPEEFLVIWVNLNNGTLTMPADHLSDSITNVKEFNQKNFYRVNKAHTDIKRNYALLDKDGGIIIENGNFKFTKDDDKKANEEIAEYNANPANNIELKCYIKPTEKLPKRLYTFQYDLIKKLNSICYELDLEQLLDDSLKPIKT